MFEDFFSKVQSVWSFLSNGDNVKALFSKMYVVVQKLLNVVSVLQNVITDPKFATYGTTIITTLGSILTVFNKLAPLLGVVASVSAVPTTPETAHKELQDALAELNELLKK